MDLFEQRQKSKMGPPLDPPVGESSRDEPTGIEKPFWATRPHVGRRPTTPGHDYGTLMELKVSSPSNVAQRLAAVAAPEPEPPVSCSTFQGFFAIPNGYSNRPPDANSIMFSFPSSTPPASFSRRYWTPRWPGETSLPWALAAEPPRPLT